MHVRTSGAVRRRKTISLVWVHMADIGHHFNGERLVKKAMHSGPRAMKQCESLTLSHQATEARGQETTKSDIGHRLIEQPRKDNDLQDQ